MSGGGGGAPPAVGAHRPDKCLPHPAAGCPGPPTAAESLINVDAWNDVVAATRSIMYSIADPAAMFDVFWFSNDVERIGWQATGAEVAKSNKFIKGALPTLPWHAGVGQGQAL